MYRRNPFDQPPPVALANGCNQRTLGPDVTLYENWHMWDFLGADPVPGQAVQNPDGTVSLRGKDGSGYGACISTACKSRGKFFAGKQYIDFLVRWKPELGPPKLPFPALWALDKYFVKGPGDLLQWKGQEDGFTNRLEPDYVQWPRDSLDYWTGPGAIGWYGKGAQNNPRLSNVVIVDDVGNCTCDPTEIHEGNWVSIIGAFKGPGSISGHEDKTMYRIGDTDGTKTFKLLSETGEELETTKGAASPYFSYNNVTMPTQVQGYGIKMPWRFDDWNHYSFLTRTASPTTQGTIESYCNGQRVKFAAGGDDPCWDMYDDDAPPPPKFGKSAFAKMDKAPLVIIIGTGEECPLDVAEVSMWQPNDSLNEYIDG